MLKSTATRWAFSALCVVTFASSTVQAQSTLFNIPSTDIVATKRVYVEFDFISHLEAHEKGGFQGYTPRVVVGVAKNLEAGANIAFLDGQPSGLRRGPKAACFGKARTDYPLCASTRRREKRL